MLRFLFIIPFFLGDCIYNFIKIHKNIQYYKKKISSFLMHLLWNECFFNFQFNCQCQIYWNHYFCLCLSSHLHLWSLHTSSILHLWPLHLWSLHLWPFICDLFICDSSSVTSSSVPLSFIHGSVHYTENIKDIRTWKMPYGINNNIFHGVNKLQEKNTLAFSNWTLQIKNLSWNLHSLNFSKN
jgi:hypothetical protein